MPEDRQDSQAPARRGAPPREPGQLREGLASSHGVRLVPQAHATNDGSLAAEKRDQAASASVRPPHSSNDGRLAHAPPVRERRVPSDSGRVPVPAGAGGRGAFPRLSSRGGRTSDDSSKQNTFPPGHGGRSPASAASNAQRLAPNTEDRTPGSGAQPAGGQMIASEADVTDDRTSFDEEGEFVGLGGDTAGVSGAPVRDGAEGDYAERDGMDFDTMPSPDDLGRLETTSGQTGEMDALRDEARAEVATMQGLWTLERPSPASPHGPDYDRQRVIVQAKERSAQQERQKRRQKSGAVDSDGENGDGTQRMSGLLQSADTHSKYMIRGNMLLKRYKREKGIQVADEDVDPRAFVAWLIGLRPFVVNSTWRLYRLGARAIIQSIPHAGIDAALAILDGATNLEDESRSVYKATLDKSGGNTSAVRAKRMDLSHFRKLRSNLRLVSRSNKIDWLDDWLVAGIHTGLRPGEWPLAHLEMRRMKVDGRDVRLVWLHVVNGKATNGRGNGTYRTLDISSYTDGTIEAIQRMVKRSEQWALEGMTVRRQGEVAHLFYKICNDLFPRMQVKYSLYSLRHQFIANMKSVYADRAKIATLIGHISIETQSEHYGKRRSSWSLHDIREIPRPMDDQVAQVQKYLSAFEEREHLRMMRKAFADGRDLENDLDDDIEDDLEVVELDPDDGASPDASGN